MVTVPGGVLGDVVAVGAGADGHGELPVGLDVGTGWDGDGNGGAGLARSQGDGAVDDGCVVATGGDGRPVRGLDGARDGVGVGARGDRQLGGLGHGGGLDDRGRAGVDELVGEVGGPEQIDPAVVVDDCRSGGRGHLESEVGVGGRLPDDRHRHRGRGLARGEGHHLLGDGVIVAVGHGGRPVQGAHGDRHRGRAGPRQGQGEGGGGRARGRAHQVEPVDRHRRGERRQTGTEEGHRPRAETVVGVDGPAVGERSLRRRDRRPPSRSPTPRGR